MNICILMGSIRKNGNTKTLLDPFIEELMKEKATVQYIWLYEA
ncbi:NAD(P)H-dependent oxidoreductase [Clostridium thermarum]|nr:NAD(P)H-dependent oxidoreductase [Clostridium thermarum]